MPTHSIHLELDSQTNDRVQRLASSQHTTSQAVLQKALSQYVEREEKRDQLCRDAEAAWSDYQSTGLHVTDEEAETWLAKLENGEVVPPPSCHV